jgi:hypothetical protein
VEHLQKHLNNPCGSTATDALGSDVTTVVGKHQGDGLFKAEFEALHGKQLFPEKSFSFREEGSSRSNVCSVTPAVPEFLKPGSNATVTTPSNLTTIPSTLPDIDSDTPSDRSRYVSSFVLSHVSRAYRSFHVAHGLQKAGQLRSTCNRAQCAKITSSYIS